MFELAEASQVVHEKVRNQPSGEEKMKIKPLITCGIAVVLAAFTSCKTTSTSTTESSEARFARADTNHDGKLSPNEASDYFVREIFAGRDLNHDGKLSWEEWNVPGSGRTKAQFDQADTNKDGFVSLEEALAWGRKHGVYQKQFREADTNHDGYVTLAEAKAYYASKEGPPR
jgi:Ca2+-binding EF-hand superfamily protein